MIRELGAHPLRHPQILELGIGPGYLAQRVLGSLDAINYEGADFSQPMLDIAAGRLADFADRLRLTKLDLFEPGWGDRVTKPLGAVVSTWALHDLGSEDNIAAVYRGVLDLLPDGGLLLNGDFVKPEETTYEYEAGRITVSRHLELLEEIGFSRSECLCFLEKELTNPTAAQNYACIYAVK